MPVDPPISALRPEELVAAVEFARESSAMAFERYLKSGKRIRCPRDGDPLPGRSDAKVELKDVDGRSSAEGGNREHQYRAQDRQSARHPGDLSEHAVDESVIEDHPPERGVTKPEQRGTCDGRAN